MAPEANRFNSFLRILDDCRVFCGDIFIVPFLGPALEYLTAMCSPGWGNSVAFDWKDLPWAGNLTAKF